MSVTGLTSAELGLLRGVFARHGEITRVVLFGSRAKGVHSPASDVDLAIDGVDEPLAAERIAGELEELPLPYRFDVAALAAIKSPALREHIERVGVCIYQ
jgi:uncharacterized protein